MSSLDEPVTWSSLFAFIWFCILCGVLGGIIGWWLAK